jgi:hypothetical protein
VSNQTEFIVRDGKLEAWRDTVVRAVLEQLVPPMKDESGIMHRHPDQLKAEDKLRNITREYGHRTGGKVYASD